MKVFWYLFVLLPGILCAFILLEWLREPLGHPSGWAYAGWMAGIVYVLECFIFFLKGWYLRLKDTDNNFWIAPWLICFFYCCALPVFMMHVIIADQFMRGHGFDGPAIMATSWVGGLFLGLLIYWRYRLNEKGAPLLCGWAYRLGRGSELPENVIRL